MRRLLRRLVRPTSRPALLFLVWSRRHTLRQWFTSIRLELARGRFDRTRFRTLVHALYELSTDQRIANSPKLRSLRIVGDVVEVDADPNWNQVPALRVALAEIPAISRVDLIDGQVVSSAAPSPSAPHDLDDLLASGVTSGG